VPHRGDVPARRAELRLVDLVQFVVVRQDITRRPC